MNFKIWWVLTIFYIVLFSSIATWLLVRPISGVTAAEVYQFRAFSLAIMGFFLTIASVSQVLIAFGLRDKARKSKTLE
ncbi:hypothetical protein [Companilactobacillus mishanensis]|uniref:DUF3923 family protein n=1 Tax=Companilactobacillus mishanensis TaxID=2486008 RepID=A0ABW9P7V9_9LACO|nr:hypothetical protein [Companilactobacillus mishanensis]MQS45320.1 hypothetical protein [Companilactobacillus mishanensis]